MTASQPLRLRIFFSSPGDVKDERVQALQVLGRLQHEKRYRERVIFQALAWDGPGVEIPMLAAETPQVSVNQGLGTPSECDIVVVILWSRMGTPLPDTFRKSNGDPYLSGTEWEFENALHAELQPEILVYRRTEDPPFTMRDPERDAKIEQFDRVERFFNETFTGDSGSITGGVNAYDTPTDFKEKLETHLRELVERRLEAIPEPAPQADTAGVAAPPEWEGSPYPGLRAFLEDEVNIFFGRGRETDALVRQMLLPDKRFLAVIGPSGSGKSSLVAAGLRPRLKAGAVEGSQDWVWVRSTPGGVGEDPFIALTYELSHQFNRQGLKPRDLAIKLRDDPQGAAAALVQDVLAGSPAGTKLVLFIDQFEELFTLVGDPYREPFVNFIAAVAREERLRTIVTLRADFYQHCTAWETLVDLLRSGSYPLGIPGALALKEMIERPAQAAGLAFEEGLVEHILEETGTEPGALALMAFALSELYKKRTPQGELTLNAYQELGGVNEVLGKRAQDTYDGLSPSTQDALGTVFKELVEVDAEHNVPTRKRAPLQRFNNDDAARALIDALTEARLLVSSSPEDVPMVEVAHEALLRHWALLSNWIEERFDDFRLLRQVKLAVAEWERHERAGPYFWPHERLAPVAKMLENLKPDLNPAEREFVRPESARLLDKLTDRNTSHQERVKIGDRLAEIGDPRPHLGLNEAGLPDIGWCEVPGGEVMLEGGAGTFDAEPGYIGKYPVTWAQYRCFLEAEGGYTNPAWWKGFDEEELEEEPGEQNWKLDNHPAENVSWYDAMAYCRWLSKKLGYEIRLPTEWEWQQAATGGDAVNEYPWGEEWDNDLANTDDSRLSRTTAVGMYPGGASRVGALDMSGNVEEWCLNLRDDPSDNDLSSSSGRVVRGGAWPDPPVSARACCRSACVPSYRLVALGFRVWCSSPIRS
ncbi:nSTAND1 domain-containing NTPase [Candidatus Entotheonella palauensis]|uniref:Uncharacterized protein n=1 Tax=Candidatus Entotheonella gemina TaxID=1429439 RepID=W4MCK6_9BACT|nr:SUMF1/EgtB/PvdO family nonheme iron enzyme [Candidatus Entotheonella palauensis]ETX08084.1 MAG: hypothetical protein ETSY2_07470 [Candidatus Entotheonella gemina]